MAESGSEDIILNHVFHTAEIQSRYLIGLVKKVLARIHQSTDIKEMGLTVVVEGPTNSGEAGEFTEEGVIILDPEKLRNHQDDVVMACIAHEFAHCYLGHYPPLPKNRLKYEDEADEQAKKWGFNVDKFRKVMGPAFLV